MHRFVLHNGKILDAHEKSLSAGQVGLLNGWGVFSTFCVADGVLFAFERHWERMHRDAAKVHVPFPTDPAELKAQLLRLIEANAAWNATLRVMVVRNRGGMFEGPNLDRDFDVLAFTKDLKKPISPQCAEACARAGSPLVILADNGTIYWPIADTTPSAGQNEKLLPFAGQRVTASGKVYARGGSTAIVIEKNGAESAHK